MEYGELEPYNILKSSYSFNSPRTHEKINHNPSSAQAGEVSTVIIPKTTHHDVIVPDTLRLSFEYHPGASDKYQAHLTSALVRTL